MLAAIKIISFLVWQMHHFFTQQML